MVASHVNTFVKECPRDFWFFRWSSGNDTQTLLLIYQPEWQQHLLVWYSQELTCLDAMYLTTRYAIPLLYVCVHTNNRYIVVRIIVHEREDSASLAEALDQLKPANITC